MKEISLLIGQILKYVRNGKNLYQTELAKRS